MSDFAAQVDAWCAESKERLLAVAKESAQELISLAVNATPVDTGFARASWRVSLSSMPLIDPGATNKSGAAHPSNFGEISATISGVQLGQTIYAGMTAAYALPLEYGHSKQAPQGMVRIAAAQWPSIVAGVVAKAKGV